MVDFVLLILLCLITIDTFSVVLFSWSACTALSLSRSLWAFALGYMFGSDAVARCSSCLLFVSETPIHFSPLHSIVNFASYLFSFCSRLNAVGSQTST
jgi:hypothetical protein